MKNKRMMMLLPVVAALMLALLFFGQNVRSPARAEDGEPLLLYPKQSADMPLAAALLPKEAKGEVKEATADGGLGDLLVPGESTAEEAGEYENVTTKRFEAKGKLNILIYHTHTTEAYRQTEEYIYTASGDSRTKESGKNIVAVGEALKAHLEAKGYSVVHDTTNHEPPKLATSYARSLKTMESYMKEYGTIDLFIDLHRDAANVATQQDDVVKIGGKRCARVMFVVGTGEGKNKADPRLATFADNYALAKSLREQLEAIKKGFTRSIRVKTGRYNQHMGLCLLIEDGHNANTLAEAINSTEHIAAAIGAVITR